MFLVYLMCVKHSIDQRNRISHSHNFYGLQKIHEELNMLMPFRLDVKVQQSQREQTAVMGFLTALPSEYDSAKAQILSSLEISSL